MVHHLTGAIVTSVEFIKEGDIFLIQKRFQSYGNQEFEVNEEDLLMEEVRLCEEKKKRVAFEKVEFLRKIKEFTRLN